MFQALAATIRPVDEELRTAVQSSGTITFSAPGTVLFQNPLLITNDIVIDGAVVLPDGTSTNVVLDGLHRSRLFHVQTNGNLELRNVMLRNGLDHPAPFHASGLPAEGGAILNEGVLTVRQCTFEHSRAVGGDSSARSGPFFWPGGTGRGGAIYNRGGRASLNDVSFTECVAHGGLPYGLATGLPKGKGMGGAIFNDGGLLELQGATFFLNRAGETLLETQFSSPGWGGAIASVGGTNLLTNCVFRANRALSPQALVLDRGPGEVRGGAAYLETGQTFLQDCSFESNEGIAAPSANAADDARGGAIANLGNLMIDRCSFSSNVIVAGAAFIAEPPHMSKAGQAFGGAIWNGSEMVIVNSSIFRNEARGGIGRDGDPIYGGGIYNEGFCALTNCTLSENVVSSPIAKLEGANLYSVTNALSLYNTILHSERNSANASGLVRDLGFNLSSDQTPLWETGTSRGGVAIGLGEPGYYGGGTLVRPLTAGSAAIDAGGPAPGVAVDQRFWPRPFGSAPDIGAFESSPPYTLSGWIIAPPDLTEVLVDTGSETKTVPIINQRFEAGGFQPGAYKIRFRSLAREDLHFRPGELDLQILADLPLPAPVQAYSLIARLALAPVNRGPLDLVYTGRLTPQIELQGSNDLLNWTSILVTNSPTPVFEIPLQDTSRPARFFRLAGSME